jgi:hypothetical protein
MDIDRLVRPSGPQASRVWLGIITGIGSLFVILGFLSSSDYHPSPVRDTVLIAGGALLATIGLVGLRSPTFSLTGHSSISPSRLYAQAGVALLALGGTAILLLGVGWDAIGWVLPGGLALHRSWQLRR